MATQSATTWGLATAPAASVVVTGPGTVTLQVAGDIDTLGTPVLQTGLDAAWSHEPSRVTLDLTGVTFIGLPGLHTLVRARSSADRRRIRLRVTAGTGHMCRLLGLVGMGDITERCAPPSPSSSAAVGPAGEVGPVRTDDGRDLVHVLRTLRWTATDPAGDLLDALRSVAATAASYLPGAEGAGILLIDENADVVSRAATNPVVTILDLVQLRSRSGPAWDGVWCRDAVVVGDLVHDPRWPAVSAEAAGLGVRSLMCLRLGSPGDPLGVLTVYACAPSAFGLPAIGVGQLFASIATSALRAARLSGNGARGPAGEAGSLPGRSLTGTGEP